MKCHLCGEQLACENIDLWKLNERRCVNFACRNPECKPPTSVSTNSSVNIHVVLPDEEVNYYLLRFPMNDRWYQITSIEIQCNPGETNFYGGNGDMFAVEPLITIPRFIPLDWKKPLDVQIVALRDKLRTLIYFI
jgi:hypothetical protein